VEFLGVSRAEGPIFAAQFHEMRQGKVLTKHLKADGVFCVFFIRDAPGKWVEVDLVYPNIYIDMSFFSLSALLMNCVYMYPSLLYLSHSKLRLDRLSQ
jgi:hypothetical protein